MVLSAQPAYQPELDRLAPTHSWKHICLVPPVLLSIQSGDAGSGCLLSIFTGTGCFFLLERPVAVSADPAVSVWTIHVLCGVETL